MPFALVIAADLIYHQGEALRRVRADAVVGRERDRIAPASPRRGSSRQVFRSQALNVTRRAARPISVNVMARAIPLRSL